MIRFAENLNKMITAGLGGAMEAPSTEVAVGHRVRYMDASGAVATFETNVAAPIRSLRVDMQPIQEGSGNPSPDNVRPITGRDIVNIWNAPTHDTTIPPTVTVQLGQTVYGGTVDVTTGTMMVDRWYLTLDNARTVSYHTGTVPSMWLTFATDKVADASSGANAMYSSYTRAGIAQGDMYARLYSTEVDVYDPRFTDEATARTLLADFMAVYKLQSPITIQLTPEQMATLKGDNTVWSDAGDVTLEYPYYEETEGY